jgi:hypothetical protein
MKKLTYLLLFLAMVVIVSCKKNDAVKPIITLKGNNPDVVEWGSAAKYSEPGAIVTDDMDGTLTYAVDSTVNMYSAASYTVTYKATDEAGNETSATRTVIVDAALYLQGIFTVKNYIGIVLNSTYTDTLSVTTTNNVLEFNRFAYYKNAHVLANLTGTTINIPQQTDTCGIPARLVTFSGTGSFVADTAFIINYTVVDSSSVFTGRGEYKLN